MLVLLASFAVATPPAYAEPTRRGPSLPQQEPVVPVRTMVVPPAEEPAMPTLRGTPAVTWPAPAAADVTLPAVAGQRSGSTAPTPARAGDLPVWVGRPSTAGRAAADTAPTKVRVELLDRAAATTAGVTGLLLRVRRGDGRPDAGPVTLTVDYSRFRHAYGGDWASRLRLTRLPDCAATTPDRAECRQPTALPTRNDPGAGHLVAEVPVTGTDRTFAVAAAPAGGTGDYTATSLSPAGSWDVSVQTGDFSWSYPMRTPPVPGGLVPELTAAYASGGTDGRVASTNNQTSWLGEGWNLWSGSIERRYRSCLDDTAGGSPRTGDLCWGTENATMSFAGRSTELVHAGPGRWRPKKDDGSRVEQLFGPATPDEDNGEHWRVTTTDGTQYYFGSRPESQSTWGVPVFGNDPGEPCHGTTFATSRCNQGWRWNLDRVVDPRGNTITYGYLKETNAYGVNMAADRATYTRGGTLDRIEYGTRDGSADQAPARVVFGTADRCVPGANCTVRTPASWPDVPWDQNCDTATCANRFSPTFWTTKRLTSVTTQVWGGADYRDVDRWSFTQEYPNPGDNTTAALWLRGITQTGLVGGSVPTPPVTFNGVAMQNRVVSATDCCLPMNKYRIGAVNTGAGGVLGVRYAPADCTPSTLPPVQGNGKRCFPVRWTPQGGQTFDDWFHRYVVETVSEVDRVGGNRTQFTNYDYEGAAAWAYRDDPLVKPEYRTWSQWRGYEKVRVRRGDPQDPGSPAQSSTRYHYFRGMGGRPVVDSQGVSHDDPEQLAGFLREEITYNGVDASGVDGPVVSGEINDPWQRGPTAVQGSAKAYQVQVGRTATRTALGVGATGGWRRTETVTTFENDHGTPVSVDERGDLSTNTDDRCTRTSYARNTDRWMLVTASRVWTMGVPCGTEPVLPDHAISDVLTYYDGGELGAAPSAGNVTKVEELSGYADGEPSYVTTARTVYDRYGRATEAYDALDNVTRTEYLPATGLPNTTVSTNALGHRSTTTLEPAWNLPVTVVDANDRRTDIGYDALGRVTGVWLPGRSRAANQGPQHRYDYDLRDDRATSVATGTLRANGNYVTSYALFDGFLRARQTQAPSWGGGRAVTDTYHDARGLVVRTNNLYKTDATAPGGTLLTPVDETLIPSQTVHRYDGAGRVVRSALEKFNQEMWATVTTYHGDHVEVTPPSGGTPTATYTDALGQTTELRQFGAARPEGEYRSTRYRYTGAGDLAVLVDPAGNEWRYRYDLRRRPVEAVDPDKGRTRTTYDLLGRKTTSTDARGQVVATSYDALGRRTATHQDSPTGPKLSGWVYDTVAKGQLASATRYVGTDAYTSTVTGYDPGYRPTAVTLTVPAAQGALAGSYETTMTYRVDGSPASVGLPPLGDLTERETVVYTYDDLGALSTVAGTEKYVNKTVYSEFGEPAQYWFGEPENPQLWHSLYYGQATRRLDRSLVERETSGAAVDDTGYTYDPAGNITARDGSTAGSTRDLQCLRYDAFRQLTDAWTAGANCSGQPGSSIGGPAPYWSSYRYDSIGNRTREVRHGLGGAADTVHTSSYPTPGADAVRPHAATGVAVSGPAGARSYSYRHDAAGNTVRRQGADADQTIGWSPDGLMTSVTVGGTSTSRTYTPDAELLVSRDSTSATLYLPSGQVRLDTATGKLSGTRYYRHGKVDVASRTSAGVDFLVHDHHGTTDLAVDAGTLAATKRRFDPFGAPRGARPAGWPGDRGFVDGTTEGSTGLTRLGVRDYDPATGTFLSVDQVLDPANPMQLNAYGYGFNNPVTFSDPSGLAPCSGPDGIDCGHKVSKQGFGDQRDPANYQRWRSYRQRWRDNSKAAQTRAVERWWRQTGRDLRRGDVRCADGARQCPPAAGEPAKRAAREALRAAEEIRKIQEMGRPGNWSGALCVSGDVQAGVGRSHEMCLAVDGKGIGWTTGTKTYFGAGSAVSGNVGVKGANTDIPGLAGGETAVGGDVKLGNYEGGVEVAVSDDRTVSVGVSGGPSFGERGVSVYGGRGHSESGYYAQWNQGPTPVQSYLDYADCLDTGGAASCAVSVSGAGAGSD
ncbi:type IV secretion protein Rhs [Plantactinospora endophytica]|uniref:Type IV secretion protein Rhs n=1 Tax=Plantactinospora endophytica TaxID=673535 RepID=A0ABQ4E1H6_9ACTN|nr:type IV secretion protein Rhs [Plantactinospora endophytica]